MATEWQKAMRRGGPPRRRVFAVHSSEQVRAGTWRLDVDLGNAGRFPVTVYDYGHIQSGTMNLDRLDESDRRKIWKWIAKNLPMVAVPPAFTSATSKKGIYMGRVLK